MPCCEMCGAPTTGILLQIYKNREVRESVCKKCAKNRLLMAKLEARSNDMMRQFWWPPADLEEE